MRRFASWVIAVLACGCAVAACNRGGATVARPRRIVDLSPPITSDLNLRRLGTRALNFLGTTAHTATTPVIPAKPAHAYGMSVVQLLSHGGAHIDAPSRLMPQGGEHPAQMTLENLYGRVRVLDLRWHDRASPLQISDLELTPLSAGDIAVLFVGYDAPKADQWPKYPPLSQQASEWLVAKRVRCVATDMPSLVSYEDLAARLRDGQPAEQVWAEYLPLFHAQIPVLEGLVNLERIVNEREVVLVGFPLPLADADGAPVRAAALVY